MKINHKLIRIIIVISIVFLAFGLISKWRASSFISKPDKIIIYINGKQSILEPTDPKFNDIVSKTKSRFRMATNTAKLAFLNEHMDKTLNEQTVIEFYYSTVQEARGREYTSLIFPLTGFYKNLCFFKQTSGNFNGPLGELKSPDSILKLVENK